MRTISVRVTDLIKTVLPIGFAGENLHTRVNIDCKIVFDEYPTATVSMTVRPPKGDAYPAIVVRDGDIVTWDVSNSDLIYEGSGELQLAFVVDEVIAKSFIGRTRIQRSIIPTGEIPDPIEDWITKADEILDSIPGQIDTALEEAKESGEFDGEDGFSPEVSVEEITGGHQISITDSEGTSTFDVMDGEKGDPGNPGSPGQDGFSPSASVSKSGNKSTITITDNTGTTTAEVLDGSTGPAGPGVASGGTTGQVLKKKSNADYDTEWGEDAGGVQIDDSAGIGDTGVTWSANKSATELSSKYEKPSGGIPSSDMDSSVQTSLGKADTAYQKPSGGIPSTDIASGVIPDVQINGTSIVNDGVANIPKADSSNYGAVKVSSAYGIQIRNDGIIATNRAPSDVVKAGTNEARPIVPNSQHESVYYGLSKLAGVDLANENVTVGTYPANSKTAIKTMLGVNVDDVQVDGTSILSNGVANVPIAGTSALGVVKPAGMGINVNSSNGELYVGKASAAQIKTGASNYFPIVPSNQHEATFYGLAKSAGADMASIASTTIGQYSNAQKIAIQKMLGIYDPPWELIREDTFTNATEADHEITVDANGDPFELTDVIFQFETPKQATYASKASGGHIQFYYGSGSSYYGPEPGAWTQEANSSAHGYTTIIEQRGGMVFVGATATATSTNSGRFGYRYYEGFGEYVSSGIFQTVTKRYISKINIRAVTGTGHYKLYGKRRWD